MLIMIDLQDSEIGEMMQKVQPISRTGSNNYSRDAVSVREGFKQYFVAEGAAEWQWELVSHTVNHNDAFMDRLINDD